MGYYQTVLSPGMRHICTLVLPWGKYEYQWLPMWLCNSPDIFQEQMSNLRHDPEFVRAYIDDVLCITKDAFQDHSNKLREVLHPLRKAGLKVNLKKSFIANTKLKYLRYWITRGSIKQLTKKVDATQKLAAPKTCQKLHSLIGLLNYYHDMWLKRSELLAPLLALLSTKIKYKWSEWEQKAFDAIKWHVSMQTLLTYPDFAQPFDIYINASDIQLGAIISQAGKPIAYYLCKLTSCQ